MIIKQIFLKKMPKNTKITSVCDLLNEVRQNRVCTSRISRAATGYCRRPTLAAKAVETKIMALVEEQDVVADPLAAKAGSVLAHGFIRGINVEKTLNGFNRFICARLGKPLKRLICCITCNPRLKPWAISRSPSSAYHRSNAPRHCH